jgi:hypothetical protein
MSEKNAGLAGGNVFGRGSYGGMGWMALVLDLRANLNSDFDWGT